MELNFNIKELFLFVTVSKNENTCTIFAEKNKIISWIPGLPSVEIEPETPQGTKLFSFNVTLNISEGSLALELGKNFTINWAIPYKRTFHYQYYTSYSHYYHPQIGVKLPGMNISTFVNLTGPIEELFPVSTGEIEQCSWGSFTFIEVPVEIYLQSPYLYHLGKVYMYNSIRVLENKQNPYQWVDSLDTDFSITANAGKISTNYRAHITLYYSLIMHYLYKFIVYEVSTCRSHSLTLFR